MEVKKIKLSNNQICDIDAKYWGGNKTSDIKTIGGESLFGGGDIELPDNQISVSYNQLVTLRNNSKLVPGQQYRITDYTCTTLEANTQSAGNVFDIIVTADSENKLNEEARAIQHTNDDTDYFANSNLSAWKIWYCLDNDTNRFGWASKAGQYIQFMDNGIYFNAIYTGSKVIDNTTYYLWYSKDFSYQYNGDEYYYIGTTTMSPASDDYYDIIWDDGDPYIENPQYSDGLSRIDIAEDGKGVIFRMIDEFNNDIPYDFKNIQFKHPHNTTYPYYYYTFASGSTSNNTDYSLSILNACYSNTIKPYIYEQLSIQYINKILFIGSNCYGNSFGNSCYNISFSSHCYDNSFGNDCMNNKFESGCCKNSFGSKCSGNSFRHSCNANSFGNRCSSNSFGNYCEYNSFGNYCIDNKFGQYCRSNSFGNSCSYNEFGLTTISSYITDNFSKNSFGNSCLHNVFGNYCVSNSFGNYCMYIKFTSSISEYYTYYQNNHFGDGCQYILFTGTETGSLTQQVQNYNFAQGLQGADNAYLTISGKRNRAYETYISKDKDGSIKESVITEKLDKMINISYNDLVALRNNSKLVPGQQYRITDYTCTTRQDKTISAGHKFDIIVTADSTNKLNEEARSIQHTGDTYFADCNLSAWKIWYCLDNDADRFTWALGNERYITVNANTNGANYYAKYVKTEIVDGTTYDLWDFGSTGGYIGTSITTGQSVDLIKNNNGTLSLYFSGAGKIIDGEGANGGKGVIYRMIDEWNNDVPYDFKNIQYTGSWGYYAYTFNWINDETDNSCEDLSVAQFAHPNQKSGYNHTCDNIIKPCGENTDGVYNSYPFKLNQCIFLNTESYKGGLFFGCFFNTFGNDCYNNSFGNFCYSNSFGHRCYSNSFGDDFHSNSFGHSCYSNSFGYSCYSNSFGNDCNNNSAGYNYIGNSFGHRCNANSFGNYCYNNSFGNNCGYIKFASNSSASTKYNFYRNNHFGDGCQYILFKGTESASYTSQVQNYNFAQGLQGSSSTYLSISGKRSRPYDTTVSRTNSGIVCGYCLANVAKQLNLIETF